MLLTLHTTATMFGVSGKKGSSMNVALIGWCTEIRIPPPLEWPYILSWRSTEWFHSDILDGTGIPTLRAGKMISSFLIVEFQLNSTIFQMVQLDLVYLWRNVRCSVFGRFLVKKKYLLTQTFAGQNLRWQTIASYFAGYFTTKACFSMENCTLV